LVLSKIILNFVIELIIMGKKLKFWNGRGHGKYNKGHIYVAAYSQKQASELVSIACYDCGGSLSLNEIREYYSDCWGNSMDGITPTEPGVWVTEKQFSKETPIKVV
jgi:hypothetical protein